MPVRLAPSTSKVVLLALVAASLSAVGSAGQSPSPVVHSFDSLPTASGPVPATAGPATSDSVPAPPCSHQRGPAGVASLTPLVPDGGVGSDPDAAGPDAADATGATTRTAVVDRFEGDRAVLLVEARGRVVARRVVRRAALPRAARHQDAVVTVTVVNDSVAAVTFRPDETMRRERRAERRFARLSEPAPGRRGPALC